jgi:hypothetical protein
MSQAAEFQTEIPVVLTATITPHVPGQVAANPEQRLAEYRRTLQFCQRFAPVYFLENSGYPLHQHPEFAETARLKVRQFPRSAQPLRGKGYQEFEMLDAWLANEPQPPARWLKISGRYHICNLAAILQECRVDPRCALIIDQLKHLQFARTYLFCVDTNFYRQHLRGIYQQCDDAAGKWIERILFRELQAQPAEAVRLFKTQPHLAATDGSSGKAFPSGRGQWLGKQILRSINRLADRKYQWYPK